MEKDTLKDDLDDFALCLDAEKNQRTVSQDDLEFAKLDKQWNEDDAAQRKSEGRPCLTINRLPSFIKQVTNDGRMNRPSINVKPVGDGASKHTADILGDLIRNIETQSQAPAVYDMAFDFAVTMGYGYFRVNVDYACEDAFEQDIMLERISNPFSVYGDYEGKEATSIDWNRAYVTDFYSKAAFEARWGKGHKAASFEVGSGDFDNHWFKDKRIRVAERWLREEVKVKLLKLSDGSLVFEPEFVKHREDIYDPQQITIEGERDSRTYKVKQRIITGTDILEENDWLGKYIPIVPMYGEEVNVNGVRHFISLIRRAKDPQRMFNFHRSAAAEVLSLTTKAPWLVAEGHVGDHASTWQTANRINHPYLTYTPVEGQPPPQRLPFSGVPVGDMQAAMGDSDDMKAVMGLFDASLGNRSNETSGVAINARKREGDTSTFDFIDNRNKAVEHGGRIIVDLIPRLYTAERIMRCVQEDGTTYTVPVNQPVAPRAEIERLRQPPQFQPPEPMGAMAMPPQGPMMGPGGAAAPLPEQDQPKVQDGPPEYIPVTPEMEMAIPPEQLKAITKIFDLTTGKYDVMVTAGPGFTTRREEAANQMMEFIRIFPQSAPLIGDLLAKNLDWPGADQVAERLKAMLPPQAAGQVPPMVQQLQQMLQQQDGAAKQAIGQLQQQIAAMEKQLADKRREDGIKQYDAETKRMAQLATIAENGLGVARDQAGQVLVVPLPEQAPAQPTVELLIEADLKRRELAVQDRELTLREREVESRLQSEAVTTNAMQMQQIDLPAAQFQQHEAMTQAMVQALQTVAASLQQKPTRKQGRAVKQPDGTFLVDSVETPIEPMQPEVPQ